MAGIRQAVMTTDRWSLHLNRWIHLRQIHLVSSLQYLALMEHCLCQPGRSNRLRKHQTNAKVCPGVELRQQRLIAPWFAPVAFAPGALAFGVGLGHGWFPLCVTGRLRKTPGRPQYLAVTATLPTLPMALNLLLSAAC
jgi:hypothetical protein